MIKPCPFCGSDNIREASDGWGNVFHKCFCCKARGPSRFISFKDLFPHQEDWDRRADPSAKEALQVIADLPSGQNEDVMEGQEQAYRAVESLFDVAPKIVCSEK